MSVQAYDQDLIQLFVAENQEMMDDVEPLLVALSSPGAGQADNSLETINAIFRLFHSMKGSAGFLQFQQITDLTHQAETVLDLVRKRELTLTERIGKVLMQVCDHLRTLLAGVTERCTDTGYEEETQQMIQRVRSAIQQNGNEPVPTNEAEKAEAIINGTSGDVAESAAAPMVSDDMIKVYVQDSEEMLEQAEHDILHMEKNPTDAGALLQNALRAMHTFKGNSGLMCYDDVEAVSHKMESVLQDMRDGALEVRPESLRLLLKVIDLFRGVVGQIACGGDGRIPGKAGYLDLLSDLSAVPARPASAEPPAAPSATKPAGGKPAEPRDAVNGAGTAQQKTIRVSVDKLDQLNNLVGEMVICESMVINNSDLRGLKLDNFRRAAHQLNLITSELQDLSMSLRMAPIDATMKKLIRLAHDVASKTNKKVELQLLGTETEVDRTVAEWVADPLVHMVRNSIDHGIEPPAERRRLGKPETGKITVEAKHQSGEVWIIVRDDGHGLDVEKIKARALERKLLNEAEAARKTPSELFTLIFEPGFSTAETVTDVSGRGVGMDVVKKNMERINGRVEIQSVLNQGTDVTIRIPLTLAIVNSMVVRAGRETYVIPLMMIRESFRPVEGVVRTVVHQGEAILLRGEVIPLFRLGRLFDLPEAESDPLRAIVMVLEASGRRVGVMVDELLGQQQTVIKGLGEGLGHVDGLSGAGIMSDGRVALIIDVEGLIRLAQS